MCAPALMAGLSIAAAVGQGVVGYMGAQQQYKAQLAASKANAENAARATVNRYGSAQLRISQEGEAAAQKKFQNRIETRKAVATAQVAAAKGNVSGISVDAVMGDLLSQSGRFERSVDKNLQMTRGYFIGEMEAAQAQGQSQINSMPPPTKPSFLPYLVNIFGSGLDAYSSYQQGRT